MRDRDGADALAYMLSGRLPAARPTWRALPGEVLLLEGREIEIRLIHKPNTLPYLLIDSEVAAATSGHLAALQELGEMIANERESFKVGPDVPTTPYPTLKGRR